MALIFYNARYTDTGEKMGKLLKENSFLGDEDNFRKKKHDYFSKGTLLWENEITENNDLTIMKKLTNFE